MDNAMKTVFANLLVFICSVSLHSQTLTVPSPDGNLVFTFSVDSTGTERGCLFYTHSYRNRNVVLQSRLSIVTLDLPAWINGFTLAGHTRRSHNERWKPVYGERSMRVNGL